MTAGSEKMSKRTVTVLTTIILTAQASLACAQGPVPTHARLWPLVDTVAPQAAGLPELQVRTDDGQWRMVCIPPCKRRLDPQGAYRFGGRGVVDSDPFRLPAAPEARLEGRLGSTMVRDVGTVLLVGGMLFAAGGGALLLLPATKAEGGASGRTILGVAGIAAGVATAGLGIVLRVASDSTVSLAAPGASQ